MTRIDDLVLELWTRSRMDWGYATSRVAEAFRRERRLSSAQRREVAERLYGMIRWARRLDYALDGAGSISAGEPRERARYLAYLLLEGHLTPVAARAQMASVDWAHVAAVGDRIARERDPTCRFGLEHSLPDWLAERVLAEQPGEAGALAAALNRRAPLTVRANLVKTSRAALAARLHDDGIESRPTRYASAGLVLETRTNVFGLAAFREGLFEVQDEASQLVAELVSPGHGLVVDACAGAGGKTLALGALMGSRGKIIALDIDGRKLEELRRRARRAGLSNVRALALDGGALPDEVEALRGRVDRVLVDAPCSGIGSLRRNPEARWRLSDEDLDRLPSVQRGILARFAPLVRPGGRVVYATCTIFRAENEDVVEGLLAGGGFEPIRLAEIVGRDVAAEIADPSGLGMRMWPHRQGTDGFFAAVLRRNADSNRRST